MERPITASSVDSTIDARNDRSASARLRSVISRAIAAPPTTSPRLFLKGDILSETAIRRPSLATRTVSKLEILSPRRICSTKWCNSSGRSDGARMDTGFSKISSGRYPYRTSAPRFQLTISPRDEMPEMASLEDSTMAANCAFASSARFRRVMSCPMARKWVISSAASRTGVIVNSSL